MTDMNNQPLPELPKMKRTRKPKPTVACECGCGGETKSRFVPGHDARLHGWVLRVERGVIGIDGVPEIHREAVRRVLAAAGTPVPEAAPETDKTADQPKPTQREKKAARKAARAAKAEVETPAAA